MVFYVCQPVALLFDNVAIAVDADGKAGDFLPLKLGLGEVVDGVQYRISPESAFEAALRRELETATCEMCIVGSSLYPDLVQEFEFVYA